MLSSLSVSRVLRSRRGSVVSMTDWRVNSVGRHNALPATPSTTAAITQRTRDLTSRRLRKRRATVERVWRNGSTKPNKRWHSFRRHPTR